MTVSVERVGYFIEEIAPKRLAEEWDNVGLLVGSASKQVDKILLCLDVTPAAVAFAKKHGFGLIVAHHPVIFRAIKSLRKDLGQGSLLWDLVQHDIAVYCAHTNWDNAALGTSHQLAQALGLVKTTILDIKGKLKMFKIIVYVPESHTENVFDSMAKAGAGHIGHYSHCSFQSPGTGTFLPLASSNPHFGVVDKLERVAENRVEMLVPENILRRVTKAMIKAHPYEEVAYDVIELENLGSEFGLGKLGTLPEPIKAKDFVAKLSHIFPAMRICGQLPELVHKVAVCGGSGAELVYKAKAQGADVLVTGDVGYHIANDAKMHDILIIDAGHFETEAFILKKWEQILSQADFKALTEIFQSASSPFFTME